MNDQQLWGLGAARLKTMLAELPVSKSAKLLELLHDYRKTKEAIAALVAGVDASSVCCDCSGQCCLNGKYRINVLDLLARISEQLETVPNFNQKPFCPFSTSNGCTMEPGLRPVDCVLFICDEIDQKLTVQARITLEGQESLLRKCLSDAALVADVPLGTPVLLWAEKLK